jgi:large subunit ribosomal protein L11
MAAPKKDVTQHGKAAASGPPRPHLPRRLVPRWVRLVSTIPEFCRQYNEKTKDTPGMIYPVVFTVFKNKSFTFEIKTPPAAVLIRKEAGLAKGSAVPNRTKVGKITKAQVRKIAELKMPDVETHTICKGP